jgi:hypothetical protein
MLLFPEDLTEASVRCLHFVEAGEETSAVDALRSSPMRVGEVDGREAIGEADLLAAIATALALPRHYRGSFNALVDGLRDDSVSPAGVLLIVRDASVVWRRVPVACGMLVEVWLDAAASRASSPMHLVFVWSGRLLSQAPPA